ncbi:MAG: DNA adenine methylase [Chthoniobacteraceae bacterium]
MSDRAASPSALLEADLAPPRVAMVDVVATHDAGDVEDRHDGEGDGGPLTRYCGGKNGSGVWQRLISMMPPHDDYIEAFLGSGAIIRRKRAAPGLNVGIDVDAGVIAAHDVARDRKYTLVCGDAVAWLRDHCRARRKRRVLVYCDPPYLGSSRAWPDRRCYAHEMKGGFEHAELLQILTTLPAMVMINGYACPQYDLTLAGWRRIEYQAPTRGGLKTEVVWMNFPEPTELHDYRFLGADFHERCRIRRKIARNVAKLAALPALERAAVIAGINAGAGGE